MTAIDPDRAVRTAVFYRNEDRSTLCVMCDEVQAVETQVQRAGFSLPAAYRVLLVLRGGGRVVAWEHTEHQMPSQTCSADWYRRMNLARDKACDQVGIRRPTPDEELAGSRDAGQP